MSCRARQKSEGKSKRAKGGGGKMTIPDIGNPDGYQKKGVAGEAKWIVVKTKGIAKLTQIGTRRRVVKGNPSKSGFEQFEWSLITLVSVAWRLLLSQELFYQYSNALWKLVRTNGGVKTRTLKTEACGTRQSQSQSKIQSQLQPQDPGSGNRA